MDENFANEISELCLSFFEKIPKTGKPLNNEWTVLSCIVQRDNNTSKLDVVSLGTGSKCLGENQLSDKGDIINDSHAEIMARRGFLRYIMEEIKNVKTDNSIFTFDPNKMKFIFKNELSFHFFTTHSPCGDATIFDVDIETTEPAFKKQKLLSDNNKSKDITENIIQEQSFTGAKLITEHKLDLMTQDTGHVRTKPGKGIRTLSVSCSDKLARWNIMGIQGALLLPLLKHPIYFETFIYCYGTGCNVLATERAIYKRFSNKIVKLDPIFKIQRPKILLATNTSRFHFTKLQNESSKIQQPSPSSIVWCKVSKRSTEVAVSGKKQGVTKKILTTPGSVGGRLLISKIELFINYIDILKLFPVIKENLYSKNIDLNDLLYADAKNISNNIYFTTWNYLKANYFLNWTKKPDNLLQFTIINK